MKKYIKKSLLLTDQDILHSLLYNIKLSSKKVDNVENNILFENFYKFNSQKEMEGFYKISGDEIILYIDKFNKIKQLLNNIALYLEIKNISEVLLYKDEGKSILSNILQIIEKQKIEKKFNIEKFFQQFEWIKYIEIKKNNLLEIRIQNIQPFKYEYKIISTFKGVTIGKYNEGHIRLDPLEKKIDFGMEIINGDENNGY